MKAKRKYKINYQMKKAKEKDAFPNNGRIEDLNTLFLRITLIADVHIWKKDGKISIYPKMIYRVDKQTPYLSLSLRKLSWEEAWNKCVEKYVSDTGLNDRLEEFKQRIPPISKLQKFRKYYGLSNSNMNVWHSYI